MAQKNAPNQGKYGKEFYEKYKSKIWTGIFLTVVLVLFVVNNSGSEPANGPYPPNYSDVNAEHLKLSDFKGKFVIVDFWATWCPPCRRAIPDLIQLKKDHKEELEVIGISVDQISRGTEAQLPGFMNSQGINYPVVNGTPQVAQLYGGIRSIPTSFLIDPDGKIISYYVGAVEKETYLKVIDDSKNKKIDMSDKVAAPDFSLPIVKAN